MFNALRSDELLVGIGQVLRATADIKSPLEEYERSQLLSAFSVSRLLAAEQIAAQELLAWARTELGAVLAGSPDAPGARALEGIESAPDGVAVGEVLCDLLVDLAEDDPRRAGVRRILRELADREVTALANLPG